MDTKMFSRQQLDQPFENSSASLQQQQKNSKGPEEYLPALFNAVRNVDYENDSYNDEENVNPGPVDDESSTRQAAQAYPIEVRNPGFVSLGRMHDRHVPPRDFPHPIPNDPKLAQSPVYAQAYPPDFSSNNSAYPIDDDSSQPVHFRGQVGDEESGTQFYPLDSENPPISDLIIPRHLPIPESSYPTRLRPIFANVQPPLDPALYDEFLLRPSGRGGNQNSSSSSEASRSSGAEASCQESNKPCNTKANTKAKRERYEQYEDQIANFGGGSLECSEQRDPSGQDWGVEISSSIGSISFDDVGKLSGVFWPKPGDVMILAEERTGCPWPAFDGHLEIYVDDDYFSKDSVGLQWNYDFQDGDIVVRFGEFDRHWRWRANEQIHVFLKDNGAFFLVSRQQAQELHPLDFRFVDPVQRPVHAIQYHFQPRAGDFVLRKGTDDSYVWETGWWHPGGDSLLLLKHLKEPSYTQGPDPKYRWTFHWHRKGFQFQPQDILLRVGYESAEDNMHSYCVCEIYFIGDDGLWTFQGRDDYSFGPPSQSQ